MGLRGKKYQCRRKAKSFFFLNSGTLGFATLKYVQLQLLNLKGDLD